MATEQDEREDTAHARDPSRRLEGPISLANWTAFDEAAPVAGMSEVFLYSDARFTGEIVSGFGPYQILNLIHVDEGHVRPALAARIEWHVRHSFDPNAKETDFTAYTGASVADELAVLLALASGGRLAAGGETRRFDVDDPRGRPINDFHPPSPLPVPSRVRAAIIPAAKEAKALDAELLVLYRQITPTDAVALVRAARAYRDALWIAEGQPELAWLLMVSSLETAATHDAHADVDPVDRLRDVAPSLAKALQSISDTAEDAVAPHVAPLFKATSRFLKFLDKFPPDEPPTRPPAFAQVKWTRRGLKNALGSIYEWRSRALHAGIPFPLPMCTPPHLLDGGYAEKVLGIASHTQGATWMNEDTPLNLHAFEYITRSSLRKWWRYLATKGSGHEDR